MIHITNIVIFFLIFVVAFNTYLKINEMYHFILLSLYLNSKPLNLSLQTYEIYKSYQTYHLQLPCSKHFVSAHKIQIIKINSFVNISCPIHCIQNWSQIFKSRMLYIFYYKRTLDKFQARRFKS